MWRENFEKSYLWEPESWDFVVYPIVVLPSQHFKHCKERERKKGGRINDFVVTLKTDFLALFLFQHQFFFWMGDKPVQFRVVSRGAVIQTYKSWMIIAAATREPLCTQANSIKLRVLSV